MKRLLLLLLLLIVTPLSARPPDPPLRVLQWNVGTINPWSIRLQDRDLPRVVDAIADAAPDVVTLQEVRDAAQAQRIVDGLRARGLAFEAHIVIVDDTHPDGLGVILSRR